MSIHPSLKNFRVIIAVLIIFFVTIIFCDIYRLLPARWAQFIALTQFIPAFLSFIHKPSITFISFIIILILTLFAGRIYCSFICPLGIVQDIFARIGFLFRIRKNYHYSQPHNFLRYAILSAAIVSYITGGTVLLLWIDPYSLYGRFSSNLILPVFTGINNIIALALMKLNIYSLHPVDLKFSSITTIIITFLITVSILTAVLLRGRFYCNTICPVGSLIGFFSKFSFFKISIDKEKCIHCGKCESLCKSSCISHKENLVDFTRCVACFNCTTACPNGSIGYHPVLKSLSVKSITRNKNHAEDIIHWYSPITRRSFFAGVLLTPGIISAQTKKNKPDLIIQDRSKLKEFKKYIFTPPPGSISIENFNKRCTACSLCITACPSSVLQPSVLQYGIYGIMQPFLDFSTGYCNYDCTLCGEICPAGAINKIPVSEKHTVKCGESVFIKENCVTYTNGTACGACSEHCPTKAIAMVPFRGNLLIPEVNKKICIGCGACEYVCPVRPFKAIYVEGMSIHQKAQLPAIEKKVIIKNEDFPF